MKTLTASELRRMSKYKAKRTVVNGRVFDSRKEARRYQELLLLERAGKISDLELQKAYTLIPAQYALSDEVYTKGIHKGERKRSACIEKAVTYKADFVYTDSKGNTVVEDVKGIKTKDYIIKRKLMLSVYGIRISEV